ncbi:16S rRNA (uracil(1498)-N(3))-methyltransferase [Pectinatus cerevisiiphilus]|uniref:Ribosomal RNA small subunit methyltransferase E n=1 Tax=Pectinatus cerevisiiphilus TaxID=86956 RepID=A0A4R3K4X2_9FIRM|nr:16S rRNA (uracil(1498)-N(3))-methyltransferase [Pectinatus cerevisiiphilus]TCS77816.1 16S rRNA (uracil1498-N3)-methyltransferase [Pectinatus cerevisiiphilus]
MRRLFIEGELTKHIVIKGKDALHLLYAMRAKPGQTVVVADKNGKTAKTQIESCEPQQVVLSLIELIEDIQESPINLILLQCLPKADKMDYIVQKAVEIGVNKIIPVESHNCVVKYDEGKKEKKRNKWQKIADEAAKQCARGIRPEICPVVDFAAAIAIAMQNEACICYENEDTLPFKQYLQALNCASYAIMIGPEGGFTEAEVEKCRLAGIKSISLGKRILRTETAAIAALAIMQYEKGDLGT